MEVKMTVKDLKKMLEKYPDDMFITNSRCSDYSYIDEEEWNVVKGVAGDCWVTAYHHTMSEEKKAEIIEVLNLDGN